MGVFDISSGLHEETELETPRKICTDRSCFGMPEMNQTIKLEDQDITVKIFECVKKAAEATHAALRANQKASDAASAIESKDKEKKWHTLQKYLREYGPFINNTTCFTGLYVYAVDTVTRRRRTADTGMLFRSPRSQTNICLCYKGPYRFRISYYHLQR